MPLDKILVIAFGLGGMALTYWYFLMKKDTVVEVENSVDIKVEGGYTPSAISIPVGRSTTINFLRTDENSCLEEVIISDFKIKKYLPLNEKVSVSVTPKKAGTYNFTCGMNMFHGKIIAT